MRKFQALSLSAALLASLLLGGCANNAASSDAASSDSAASEPEATPEPTPAPPAANPLTGAADADYTGKRPVAVTLRNMTGSTPQWGIASADVLVEGVTEGTTASLMALYANPDSIAKAGPVGPARDLLLQVALPLNAVPVHIDKNIYASNLLNTLAYQDLDGYHIGKTAFAFDQDRQNAGYAEENCWYTTAELINSGLASYGVSLNGDNTPLFQFGERPAVDPADRSGMNLTITFSPDDIDCLNYDTGTGLYALSNGDGSPVQDADNGQQVGFTNVFVFYASSGIKDDGYTRQYDMTAGTGLYLQLDQGGCHRPLCHHQRGGRDPGGQPGQELHRHLGRLLWAVSFPDGGGWLCPDPAGQASPAGIRYPGRRSRSGGGRVQGRPGGHECAGRAGPRTG